METFMPLLGMLAILLLPFIIKTIWQAQKTTKDRKKPPTSTASATIYDLPVELFLEMTKPLSPISRVCLALTCKSFLNLLGGSEFILSIEEIHFPSELIVPLDSPWNEDKFTTTRWKFLCLLEDTRWKLCVRCLKLHPIPEFSELALRKSAKERTCVFGLLVGTVHVCPCVKITFPDKLKLVERLKTLQAVEGGSTRINPSTPNPGLNHECALHYKKAEIRADTTLFLHDEELIAKTKYNISCSWLPTCLMQIPRLCCPHLTIYVYVIYNIYFVLIEGSKATHKKRKYAPCRWCKTAMVDFEVALRTVGPDSCSFTTLRRLGKGETTADEVWYNQTDLSSQMLDPKERLERDPWSSRLSGG